MFKFVVLFAALAVASAKPQWFAPTAYSAYAGYPYAGYSAYSAPAVVAPYSAYAYPQHYPLIGANGVPLDTPEVVAAKANHFTAKALATHGIHKRAIAAVPLAYSAATPYAYSGYSGYSAPLVSAYSAGYVAPASYGYQSYGAYPYGYHF